MMKPLVMASLMLVTIGCTASIGADESKAPVPAPPREVTPKAAESPVPGTPQPPKQEEPAVKPDTTKKADN